MSRIKGFPPVPKPRTTEDIRADLILGLSRGWKPVAYMHRSDLVKCVGKKDAPQYAAEEYPNTFWDDDTPDDWQIGEDGQRYEYSRHVAIKRVELLERLQRDAAQPAKAERTPSVPVDIKS